MFPRDPRRPRYPLGDLDNTVHGFALAFKSENGTAEPAEAVEIPNNYATLCRNINLDTHLEYCPNDIPGVSEGLASLNKDILNTPGNS